MPENDTTTSGGAIATAGRVVQLVLAANDDVEALSDGADTRTCTVTGRDATGAIVSDTITLNGTTPAQAGTPKTFERILKVVLSAADGARTVTIRRAPGGATVVTLPPNITSQRALFYDSASEASQAKRYEKIYWKNAHGSLTLNAAKLKLTADPQARIKIGVESSADQSVANRKTAPGGVTFVDDNVDIDITSLAAGAAKGLWVEQDLPASDPAFKNTFTTQLAGTTV
jgi:hypothetical protein